MLECLFPFSLGKDLCASSAACRSLPTGSPLPSTGSLSTQGNGGGSCRTTGYPRPGRVTKGWLELRTPDSQCSATKVQRFHSQNPLPFGMFPATLPGLAQATRMHEERGASQLEPLPQAPTPTCPCPCPRPRPVRRGTGHAAVAAPAPHAQSVASAADGLQACRGRCMHWAALAGKRAGRPPPWWCAVQHFSNRQRRPRGDGGRGAAGAAELPCLAEPSRGGGPEASQTSGARGPGSSARRSAAVSWEVRAPGGAGAFPRGAGAGLNLGPPQPSGGPGSRPPSRG